MTGLAISAPFLKKKGSSLICQLLNSGLRRKRINPEVNVIAAGENPGKLAIKARSHCCRRGGVNERAVACRYMFMSCLFSAGHVLCAECVQGTYFTEL